jgi:magnesium-transporting ATPase (P-type)
MTTFSAGPGSLEPKNLDPHQFASRAFWAILGAQAASAIVFGLLGVFIAQEKATESPALAQLSQIFQFFALGFYAALIVFSPQIIRFLNRKFHESKLVSHSQRKQIAPSLTAFILLGALAEAPVIYALVAVLAIGKGHFVLYYTVAGFLVYLLFAGLFLKPLYLPTDHSQTPEQSKDSSS